MVAQSTLSRLVWTTKEQEILKTRLDWGARDRKATRGAWSNYMVPD